MSEEPQRVRNFALDGMRALAIVAIVLYHLRPSLLRGGFVGVTAFFVISGFLITQSVERQLRQGGFHYGRYLLRRVLRLWPAALAMIGLTALGTYLFAPSLLGKVQSDVLPAACFVSNWSYIFRNVSYFDAAGLPSPLTHLWYLGLTMQLYLLWPLLLVLKDHLGATRRQSAVAALVLALASAALMLALGLQGADSARMYYGTDARFAEFGLGAFAYYLQSGSKLQRHRTVYASPQAQAIMDASLWLGPAALALLALASFVLDGNAGYMYPFGFVALALLCAVMVLGVQSKQSSLRQWLSIVPLRAVGKRSFSVYLVHYPILIFMNPATRTIDPAWWEVLLQLAVVAVAAELFYRLVEAPALELARELSEKLEAGKAEAPAAAVPAVLGLHANKAGHSKNAPALASQSAFARSTATGEATFRVLGPEEGVRYASRGNKYAARHAAHKQVKAQLKTPQVKLRATTAAAMSALCGLGLVSVLALGFVPVDWKALGQERSSAMRAGEAAAAEIAAANGSAQAGEGSQEAPVEEAQVGPIAEKVPSNLPWQSWNYNETDGTCDASVLMIGDSITEDAASYINALCPNVHVDGKLSRQLWSWQETYDADVAAGNDRDVIICALGSNADIRDDSQLTSVVDSVGGKPLYFLTIRTPYDMTTANNEAIRRVASQYDNVGVIDWFGTSEGHSEYLYDDGMHLTDAGNKVYAEMIRRALIGR